MRWDGHDIWAISRLYSSSVCVLRRDSKVWEEVSELRDWRRDSDSMCWGRYIVLASGRQEEEEGNTASIYIYFST